MLILLLDALIGAATITLRFTTVLFVRFHPLGPRYLPRIYWSFGLALLGITVQLVYSGWHGVKSRRRRFTAPLLGVLDLKRPRASAFGVLGNCLCILACLDFVYRGHYLHQSRDLSFSRVGHVDDASAKIVARIPWLREGTSSAVITLSHVDAQPAQVAPASQTILIANCDDFTGTFHLTGLTPGTNYSYEIRAVGNAPASSAQEEKPLTGFVQTLQSPSRHPKRWSLISTSCIKPFYPYNPLSHGLRIPGLEHLSTYLSTGVSDQEPLPDLMFFLGDFIYIDLPLPIGWSRDAYTAAYRQVYASPSWTPELRAMSWLHVYDDHEIRNDWDAGEGSLYGDAMAPYQAHQGRANPDSGSKTYYTFQRGDISFFVLDTRRYRSPNSTPDGPDKTMLGRQQLHDLEAWLVEERAWKVVVSSVPFTRNWRGPDARDSWAGYLWERDLILDAMKRNGGAVILSGDRHEHATTMFPANGTGQVPVIEYSTSPLSQFYEPFDRHHRQIEDTDISIHSHPWGNSKFGVVTFDTAEKNRLVVHFDLVVNGEKTWEHEWVCDREHQRY